MGAILFDDSIWINIWITTLERFSAEKLPMILIVAPFTYPSENMQINLGANRKLEMIIEILSDCGPIFLVNTSHPLKSTNNIIIKKKKISNINLIEIVPKCYKSKKFGKFLNLFQTESIIKAIKAFGRPKFIWFYNGYALEMILAKKLNALGIPMILEFEDWHFSRNKFTNLKPFIDFYFWSKALNKFSVAFAVNKFLFNKIQKKISKVFLLPGLIDPILLYLIQFYSFPFKQEKKIIVGYFGGLNSEKGAHHILSLFSILPKNYIFVVTGSGDLAADFLRVSSKNKDRFKFKGIVKKEILYNLMLSCDILIKPHSNIAEMKHGVFPFKVMEYIATNRLVISTTLPVFGLEKYTKGVYFVQNDKNSLYKAILDAKDFYFLNRKIINASANIVKKDFCYQAVKNKILSYIV